MLRFARFSSLKNRRKAIVSILFPLLLLALASLKAEEVSIAEQEDLGFIQNLFQDESYQFAKQEAEIFKKTYPSSPFLPDILLIQAQIDVAEKMFDKALRQYDLIMTQYPKSKAIEDALYFSGALRIQLNHKDGSSYLERLLSQFPDTKYRSGISFHKGKLAFTRKQWNQAETDFRSVLKGEGISEIQRVEAQHYLAWIYYFQGKTLLAKSLFLELLESMDSERDKAKIAYQLGVDAQKNGHFRKAISWFERQITEWPHPKYQNQSRYWIADSLYQIFKKAPTSSTLADKEKAIQLYTENLNSTHPVSPFASRLHRGWLELALDRPDKAESDFAWLQATKFEYAANLELTATRTAYLEKSGKIAEANSVYANALEYQREPIVRSMLIVSLIRNSHRLKDCPSVIKWSKQANFPEIQKEQAEIQFYSGQCYYANQQWAEAGHAFSLIPLESQYGKAVFSNYLTVFRKTGKLREGLDYLSRLEQYPDYGNLESILLLKIDLSDRMERWETSFENMQRMEKEIATKGKDPWFLLNIAKTADRITKSGRGLKTVDYPKLALKYYEKAYTFLPPQDSETRLSLLDILIGRHLNKSNHSKVVQLYQDAIQLVPDQQRKAELKLLVAKIQLQKLAQKELAQKELLQIHKAGDSDIHYEASSLLAELYVEQKKLNSAIKILEELASQKIQTSKWYPVTHFRLAELYQAKEKWKMAVRHYDFVVKSKQKSTLQKTAKERTTAIKKYLAQQSQIPKG